MPIHLHRVLLSFALSLPLSFALAQTRATSTPAIATTGLFSVGCPVNFSAQRKSFWAMSGSNDRTTPKAAISQAVQLTFTQSDAGKISKAAVTVHGTSGRLQTISSAEDAPNDAWTESFLIERSEGAPALPTRTLRTKAMATSNWVEITQIDFIDGAVWKEQSGAQCVLVAGD
jgi:hypothetical protein